jgi:putative glycerol-1-phosphate prenyltransferase
MKTLYTSCFASNNKQLAILIDPEKHTESSLEDICKKIEKSSINLIFVGSSLSALDYNEAIKTIKSYTSKPIVLFPGNSLQLSSRADALLNLSLISGRNPELLIGEHVKSAMYIKKVGIEVIPTGYVLIESGAKTSVEYVSNTQSIPRTKPDIAVATAVAGELLGLKCIYLEGGSGAEMSVPNEMIKAVANHIDIPIICGGGIKSKAEVEEKWKAGAEIVVIGTAFEKDPNFIAEFK